ncbi:hypothetical protein L6R49_05080 [Myxococcota bacterium]|nr:hypothetical protein [Myxococcota bacterium]
MTIERDDLDDLPSANEALPDVVRLALAVRKAGGRALLVGGWVRDRALGIESKDLDVEVHGLDETRLAELLRRMGRVNVVGRSFGVYKLTVGAHTLDVSLPRRDSKVGPGHRGIEIAGDPFMGVLEAARRRDLTVNAMLYDPLTGETLDPHGGLIDLQARRLREVDPTTFLEDPLRALRAVQFAARFGFTMTESLRALCRVAPLMELPAERVRWELEKLLLKAPKPSDGLRLLVELELLPQVLPGLVGLVTPTLLQTLDRAAIEREGLHTEAERLTVMWAALLSPFRGDALLIALDRLGLHTHNKYPLRARVIDSLREAKPTPLSDADLRRLADVLPLPILLRVRAARFAEAPSGPDLLRADRLGVLDGPLPRLLSGADLARLGVPPGPRMGELLDAARDAQTRGELRSVEDARTWLTRTVNTEG